MKEFKIIPPEGYEIDEENSTFDCIKFKPIVNFRNNTDIRINGCFISDDTANIISVDDMYNIKTTHNIFATKEQAKSALAMAQISQIMANDKRFGGIITDEEWDNINITKYIIRRDRNSILCNQYSGYYEFMAFHTAEQRNLFLKENEDLVRDYLML